MQHTERLDAGTLERPFDPRPRRTRKPVVGLIIAALIVAGAAGLLVWQQRHAQPSVVAAAPPAAAPTPGIAPQPSVMPPVRHPIEAVAAPAEPAALPALADSDAALRDAVSALITAKAFDQLAQSDHFVRRFVATVDNVPRTTLAADMRPIKPAPGAFTTVGPEGSRQIGLDNADRYAAYVGVLSALDARQAAAVYARHYPLFQQAYQELGYPGGYFNDRLVDAIDNVLATPDVGNGGVALTQPKVLYEYADPALQSLSAGQKALLRMGPDNAAKVKAKLRELRRIIAAQRP
jgi:DUF3014 family protein